MKTIKLIAREDSEMGGIGLLIKGMCTDETVNPARGGLQIAHDLIEHVNGVREIGTIDDELEALGAIWYVRGQFNDLHRDSMGSAHDVYANIAGDVVRMFRDYFYGAYASVPAKQTRPCEADEAFKIIIDHMAAQAIGEADKKESVDAIIKRRASYIAICLPRMRIGYRKAVRKYKTAAAANNLFWAIADAVEPYAKHCEYAEYVLRYGFRQGWAFAECEEFFGDDYDQK